MSPIQVGFRHLPAPIVNHLKKRVTRRRPKPHVYHVTELLYCQRKAYFNRIHPKKRTFNVRSLWNIYRGNIFDKQWSRRFKINQRTYTATREHVTITGTLDFVYNKYIYDLKMPASIALAKFTGAYISYKRQVAAYIELAHENGELLNIHAGRILMVAENVVVDEQKEWVGMLDSWLFPRAFRLDTALEEEDPSGLEGPEEKWECNPEYCSADTDYRIAYALQKGAQK